MNLKRLLPFVVLALGSACASTGAGGAADARQSSANELTRADIEESMQVNAFDLIRQMRPRWLRVRGPNSFNNPNPIRVYVDGVRYGDVESLRGIPVLTIDRIRHYDASSAQARFGLNHTNGAIEVITREY